MNRREKRIFVNELIDSTRKSILENIPKMPEQWDGHELRAYIAEMFRRNSNFGVMADKGNWRRRDYDNEVIVRNL